MFWKSIVWILRTRTFTKTRIFPMEFLKSALMVRAARHEGDIVRLSDLNYKVYWDSGEFRAACPYYHKYHSPMLERIQLLSVCEVIGNIHENPELLND